MFRNQSKKKHKTENASLLHLSYFSKTNHFYILFIPTKIVLNNPFSLGLETVFSNSCENFEPKQNSKGRCFEHLLIDIIL